MKFITTIFVALLISVNSQANTLQLSDQTHFGSKTAFLVFFDVAGLNNFNSNRALVNQNLAKYNQIVNKQNLRKANVKTISYYTMDEQIKLIGKIDSNKAGKLFRESKEIMKDVIMELKEDRSKKAKDVISTFHFINSIVDQSYLDYEKVTVLVFSNLRDSLTSKEERKKLQPITINKKVSLYLFSASGLGAINGITTLQRMKAESSLTSYYKYLLSTSNVVIRTIY